MRVIDADALKSALEIEQYNDYDDLLRTERLIDQAPTIKAFTLADIEENYRKGLEKGLEERPHGEWIIRRNKQGTPLYIVCSKCNAPCLETGFPKFCPNCGASMVKKEGETEWKSEV